MSYSDLYGDSYVADVSGDSSTVSAVALGTPTPYFGPVATRMRNPQFRWTSAPDNQGMRDCSISGVVQWVSAQQLSELIDNPDRLTTIGGQSGVLEYVVFDDELIGPFTGWYLLQSFELTGDQQWSGHGLDYPVPFSIKAVFVGDNREAVVVRSAHVRANDFGIVGSAVTADPFFTEGGTDGSMLFSAGVSATLYREYDYRPFDPAPPALSPTGNKLIYLTTLGSATDWLTVVPVPRRADEAIPTWVANRGGNCRAWDAAETREVYGPSHYFSDPTDLVITNGLLRLTLGASGAQPSVVVSAFQGGAWHDMGSITFGASGTALQRARLRTCTPDVVSIAAPVQVGGEATITLRRGERMVRFQLGADRPPLVSTSRSLAWVGSPVGPNASSGGRRVQSSADSLGFTRVLMALHPITDDTGFAIKPSSPSNRFDCGAALARAGGGDDAASQHAQFVASSSQWTRVR